MLTRLYDRYFGPDADIPRDGYEHRAISAEIERYILEVPSMAGEDGQPSDTPISVRANQMMATLKQAGWLKEFTTGVKPFVLMPPAIIGLLGVLKQFAEEGPQIVAGSVQIVHNTLKQVRANPGEQAAAFHQAATETMRLVAGLKATGVRVEEVMERLEEEGGTAAFIKAFFQQYISEIYIRDYQELRTANHPLRFRHDILRLVAELRDDQAARRALLAWYATTFRTSSNDKAEELLQRDFDRLGRFHDIQRHLDDLDDSVQRATQKAITAISYSLRVQGRMERLIEQAVDAVLLRDGDDIEHAFVLAPGQLFTEGRLREPNEAKPAMTRTATRRVQLTPRQKALIALRKARDMRRNITSRHVASYASRFASNRQVSSDDLTIESISDLCIVLEMCREAGVRTYGGSRKTGGSNAVRSTRGLVLHRVPGEWTENEYLRLPRFTMEFKGVG
ncbi:hypothetical protein ED208_15365 [Stagnimonas aquatica]|uniref:Uncharacterized protein n=1 Tax=Stagnimonas aquatica TaxID=2689987 RepID=A0A3N0V0S6_9GAMM|nr:Wadjet anti-phage system protein JetA family protein [Stagnimonas aquatica]ROH86416.1 hypothetical protein ED208_15365 [Stagnimonas aquatica]